MNLSSMFSLNLRDVAKGLVLAVISAVVTYVYQATLVPGFTFGMIDLNACLTIGGVAGVSYLVKNYFSTPDGKVMGVIG